MSGKLRTASITCSKHAWKSTSLALSFTTMSFFAIGTCRWIDTVEYIFEVTARSWIFILWQDKTLQMKTNKYHHNTCKAMFYVIHKNQLIKLPTYNNCCKKYYSLVCLFCKEDTWYVSSAISQIKATFCFLVLDMQNVTSYDRFKPGLRKKLNHNITSRKVQVAIRGGCKWISPAEKRAYQC